MGSCLLKQLMWSCWFRGLSWSISQVRTNQQPKYNAVEHPQSFLQQV